MIQEFSPTEKDLEFVSFCIEMYADRNHVSGADAAELFRQSGLLRYLYDSYDMLHTQGKDYILSDIDIFLARTQVKS